MLMRSYQAVGKTPIFKEGQNVFDEFVYTFSIDEYSGPLFQVGASYWLKEKYESLEYSREMEKEKEWWVYALLVMKKSFQESNQLYGEKACSRILLQVEELEIEDLKKRVNVIAAGHNEQYPNFFHPRLSKMKEMESAYYEQYSAIRYVADKLDDTYRFIASVLPVSHIRPSILDEIEAIKQFTNPTFWLAEYILTNLGFFAGAVRDQADNIEGGVVAFEEELGLILYDITHIEDYDVDKFIEELLSIIGIRKAIECGVKDLLG